MSLENKAKFIYEAARLQAIANNAPVIPKSWDEREEAFKKQFVEVIERQCGEQRSNSPEELHGSWVQAYFSMGWKYGEKYDPDNKIHPDLVPFEKLSPAEKIKDWVFIKLCEIARESIE